MLPDAGVTITRVTSAVDATPPRYVVILTHNRPDLLAACVAATAPQVDLVLVVDNASDPPATVTGDYDNVTVVYDGEQPPNLARLWNRALDSIERHQPADVTAWDVALLCDDTAPPPGWYGAVSTVMRAHGCAAGSTHRAEPVDAPIIKTEVDHDFHNRMPGWAFMVRGEVGLRADDRMAWWFLDDDLGLQARLAGGAVIAPGPVVINTRPNDFTHSVPGLAEQTGRDREAFRAKWGDVWW